MKVKLWFKRSTFVAAAVLGALPTAASAYTCSEAGILSTLTSMQQAIAARDPIAFAASIADTYLEVGETKSVLVADITDALSNASVASFTFSDVTCPVDTSTGLATINLSDAAFTLVTPSGTQTNHPGSMIFKNIDSAWRMYGNQFNYSVFFGTGSDHTGSHWLNLGIHDPQQTIKSALLSGGPNLGTGALQPETYSSSKTWRSHNDAAGIGSTFEFTSPITLPVSYTLTVIDINDRIWTRTVTYSAFNPNFVSNLAPSGNYTDSAPPVFSWTAPAGGPYNYVLQVKGVGADSSFFWMPPGNLGSATSVTYSGSSPLPSCITYFVFAEDADGNGSMKSATVGNNLPAGYVCSNTGMVQAVSVPTRRIAAGGNSSLFLKSDGSVWGTGRLVDYNPGATSPVRLFPQLSAVSVATGSSNSFALLADGTLLASGTNSLGQLGDGTTEARSSPQRVADLSGIKAVSAARHVLALKEDGTVWAWGNNDVGQLGDGTKTSRYVPGQVIGLSGITRVSTTAGGGNSLALKSDGTVWVWGSIGSGKSGDGLNANPSDPTRSIPGQVLNLDRVVEIAAGGSHHMALRDDGTVWTWGWGLDGLLGAGMPGSSLLPVQIPGLNNIVAIDSKGDGYSLALKADGTVWAWGNNNLGQLGVDGITYSATPIQVPGLTEVVAIAAGNTHALALRRDDTVLAWGSNREGQLGDNSLQDHFQAAAVVGPGGAGQLNLLQAAPASYNALPQAQISLSIASGRAPLTVQASAFNASDADGTVTAFLWRSSDGQQASGSAASFVFSQAGTYDIDLLIEDNNGARGRVRQQIVVSPAPGPDGLSVSPKVGMSFGGSIALASDGRILTWPGGSGLYDAQLKASIPKGYSLPIANGIVGAVDFAFQMMAATHVLLADGTVLGWGANAAGSVGGGSHDSKINQPVSVSGLPSVLSLAAGWGHSLALTRDGRVFAWGRNVEGELGLGDQDNRFEPVEVADLSNVIAIAASGYFSAALKADGSVWAWGENSQWQLGDSTQVNRNRPIQIPGLAGITKIFAAPNGVFAQKADGTMWVTGNIFIPIPNDPGAWLGPRHLSVYDGVVQIAAGAHNVIALKADGSVWTGGATWPALGFESSTNIAGLAQVPGIADAIAVAAGFYAVAVVRRDGTVLTWGLNDGGQLGDGTLAQRVTPVAVVNEIANGYLNLIPGAVSDVPASASVPFFVVTSGDVSSASATVSTTTKFNAPDVGKSGAVFVTAMVPSGSLVPAQSSLAAYGAYSPIASAAATSNPFVLIQLTASGWQPVVNGQLIAYANGVLGDQLRGQTILNNTDTTNLKGAQFCTGYGTSAEQMIAVGTMRVVATIPDPNATGAVGPSCIAAGPSVNYSLLMPQGWNLLGNSLNQTLSVASLYGDPNTVTTVWKWNPGSMGWQFYAPSMDAAALQSYTASKGYGVLSEIKPGEGYWVNAKAQPTIGTQSGASFILTSGALAKGWNLVATGNDISPSVFNTNLKASLPGTGVTTLWAWDNPSSRWYFYAPSLEAQGGTALSDYIANKGYLDFTHSVKTLGNGTGFWVNR